MVFAVAPLIVAACNSSENSDSGPASAGADSDWTPPGVNCPDGCTVVNPSAPHFVSLEAAQVVDGSIESGSGTGELEIDRGTRAVKGSVSTTGLDAVEVTLNRGYAGENGPVLARFDKISASEWSLPPSATLTSGDAAAMDTGGLYVIATSATSPDGAVRGQVRRPGAVQVYFFTLFGSQIIPSVTSSASATAAITTSAAVAESGVVGGKEDLVLHVNVHGLNDVTSVHVHEAMAGANGPVLVDLVQDAANADHWFTSRTLFDDDAIAGFENGYCVSGGCDYPLYLDVHTGSYPDGELRAQLGFPSLVQFVSLSGDDVVPGFSSINSGTVATTITDIVDWEWTLELTMNLNLEGLDDAMSVTLNYAPVGQNGPVVYSLERDPDRSGRWFGKTLLIEPDVTLAHGWYFSVTTPDYPDGELRGQWETHFNSWLWVLQDGFFAKSVSPADGSTNTSWPSVITIDLNRDIEAESVGLDIVDLLASGGDAIFNNGNDLPITPVAVAADGETLIIELGENPQAVDVYQLRIGGVMAAETGQVIEPQFISTFAVDSSHPSPSFAQLQQEIFTPNCAQAGCHGGAKPALGLDLSAGTAFENIVNVPSAESDGLDLVEPGEPEASYIVAKLFKPWWDPHPYGQPRLSNASMQRLRQWIAEGAQNN